MHRRKFLALAGVGMAATGIVTPTQARVGTSIATGTLQQFGSNRDSRIRYTIDEISMGDGDNRPIVRGTVTNYHGEEKFPCFVLRFYNRDGVRECSADVGTGVLAPGESIKFESTVVGETSNVVDYDTRTVGIDVPT